MNNEEQKVKIPEGIFIKCEKCHQLIYHQEFTKNLKVCIRCGYYFRLTAKERIEYFVDKATFIEYTQKIKLYDPLNFKDIKPYKKRIKEAQLKTKLKEAVIIGEGKINNYKCHLGFLEFEFLGGSMGAVVGDRITELIERATITRLPLIIFCASGGARMQEGVISLMQMAKINFALAKLRKENVLYISVLCDPTTGGVSASFATAADIIIAEEGATIGFAGRRVIEKTINQSLPDEFQKAEFLLQCGLVDMVVKRTDLKDTLSKILSYYE